MKYALHEMSSPLGKLWILADDKALLALTWNREDLKSWPQAQKAATPLLKKAQKQLQEYFEGQRKNFDLPLAPLGTEFQQKAWRQLTRIPFGQTLSYAEQAEKMGKPKAVRAVGSANGRNPLPILVPCHRVIGRSGHLTGYAGGLARKRLLLEIEGLHTTKDRLTSP